MLSGNSNERAGRLIARETRYKVNESKILSNLDSWSMPREPIFCVENKNSPDCYYCEALDERRIKIFYLNVWLVAKFHDQRSVVGHFHLFTVPLVTNQRNSSEKHYFLLLIFIFILQIFFFIILFDDETLKTEKFIIRGRIMRKRQLLTTNTALLFRMTLLRGATTCECLNNRIFITALTIFVVKSQIFTPLKKKGKEKKIEIQIFEVR